MKKILFLLLITTSVFAQLPSKFDKIKVVNATKNNDATRVVVQDSITKEYHWVLKSTVGTGTVTSVTGTDGITVANGTTTPVIGINTIAQSKVMGLSDSLAVKQNSLGYAPENTANKSATLVASSTLYPNNNAVNTGLALKSDKINFINIKDLGGVGDGITDNTTLINSALETYEEVYFPDGKYLVTNLVNPKGNKISGSGKIVKTVPFGEQLLNTEADKYQYIFGTEYLSHFHKELIADNTTKATLSGNSTTFGDATTAPFHLDSLLDSLCDKNGVSGVTWVNAGHSGEGTTQWLSTNLSVDMAGNPDLYVIDWAINDGSLSADPITAADLHVANIKIGLQRIRGAEFGKTLAEMSIVLTSPNATTDDSFGHHSELFNERVASGLKQLSREFYCVFINKFAFYKDGRHEEHMEKYDLGGGNFTYIHPLDVMNTWISSMYFEAMFPEYYRNSGIINNKPNLPNGSVLFSKTPTAYSKGITLDFSGADSGFPYIGTVTTIKQDSGTALQFLSDYDSGFTNMSFRTGFEGTWQSFTPILTGVMPVYVGGEVKLNSDAVGTYIVGESIHFAYSSNGFPINGTLITNRTTTADVTVQTLSAYDNGASVMYIRGGWNGDGWMAWERMANIASPAFTGMPTAPTATLGTNTTQIATTAFVQNIRPYKVYTALLTQSGTSAPTAVVLENNLGGTVVWSRTVAGSYFGTLSDAFTTTKTSVLITNGSANGTYVHGDSVSTSNVNIITPTDGQIDKATIEIRVYN